MFDGADEDATDIGSHGRVRLEYFPDPGPAATAVRIKGTLPTATYPSEGIALPARHAQSHAYARRQLGLEHRRAVAKVGKLGIAYMLGVKFPPTKSVSVHVGDLSADPCDIRFHRSLEGRWRIFR